MLLYGVLSPMSNIVLYPAASHNISAALPLQFYDAYTAGNPYETGTPYNLGFDAQAVHGTEAKLSGNLVSVGQSWETEDGSGKNGPRSAFAMAVSEYGLYVWSWLSDEKGADEGVVAVACMQADAGGDFIAAGFYKDSAPGSVFQRYLVRLDHLTGKLVWAAKFNTTASEDNGTHATFESIALDSEGNILLGGVTNNIPGTEFKFKSAGNVPHGDAFVWRIPESALKQKGGPTDVDVKMAWSDNKWTSVKAVRQGDPDGNAIALVHREFQGTYECGLTLIDTNTGSSIWGPYLYKEQTEGTDLAVAPDWSGFAITGHGSTTPVSKAPEYKGRITRVTEKGVYLWTKEIFSNPTASVVYNECWGIQPYWEAGKTYGLKPGEMHDWIVSCGTGIENMEACHDSRLSEELKTWCIAGAPSAWGGIPRMPSVWSNNIVAVEDSLTPGSPGEHMWSQVSSFVHNYPGARSMSSAAEFITPVRRGGFYVTTDENFGIGFLRVGGSAAPPSPPPSDSYGGNDDAGDTNLDSGDSDVVAAASVHRVHHRKKISHQAMLMEPHYVAEHHLSAGETRGEVKVFKERLSKEERLKGL